MHRLHASEGVVLGKRPVGEASVLVSMLTKDLGLVRAHARSARAERSKLRYALEPLTRATYSFVRGKYEWKLTGAQDASFALRPSDPRRAAASGRIARLLMRLIRGEEPGPALYRTVSEGLESLARAEDDGLARAVETVIVLRALAHLGYIPESPELMPFLQSDFFSMELAAAAQRSRALLIRTINESLGQTGL